MLAQALAPLAPLGHVRAHARYALLALMHHTRADGIIARARKRAQVKLSTIDRFGDRLWGGIGIGQQRVADPVGDPAAQLAAVAHVVDEHVRQRRVDFVGAVDAEQASDRALDRHGRLARDLVGDLTCYLRSRRPARRDQSGIQVELAAVCLVRAHVMSRTIGNGMTSRSVSRSVRIMIRRSTPMPPPAVGE